MKLARFKGYFLITVLFFLFLGKHFIEVDLKKYSPPLRGSARKVVNFLAEESPKQALLSGVGVVFGLKEVVSDFLFLQVIQIFGEWSMTREERFRKVYPLIQTLAVLSPHFVPTYSFGALVLEELGYVDKALELLDKGITENPYAFELWLYRDFSIYLFKLKEYKKAIRGIKRALELEGHPPVLERILAYAYEKDGQIESAILQWERVYMSTSDARIKEICKKHIERLKKEKGKVNGSDKGYNFNADPL